MPKTKTNAVTLNLKGEIKNPSLETSYDLVKQKIKSFVITRKNFLFSNVKSGAKVSSMYFSLIESTKMNKLNPYKYLIYAGYAKYKRII